MKASLFLPIVSLILNSCSRDSIILEPATPSAVSVELPFYSDQMIAMSRSVDVETLRDLNFSLYDGNGVVLSHRYQTFPTLHFKCLPGNYSVRIDANWGRDLEEIPARNSSTVTHADDYEVLPMVWEGDVASTPLTDTQHVPLGDTFSESHYMNNSQIARFYTNDPYHYR